MNGAPLVKAVLIIPALNEEPVIGLTLKQVPRALFKQIIVADNGSSDRTAEIARQAGATVVSEPQRGYGSACRRALASLPPEVDTVVFMDADSSDDPREAVLLLQPILTGRADFVLGSRTMGKAEQGSLRPHQRFGNELATFLIRVLFGHSYSDLGPFRAIRLDSLQKLDMQDRNYGWTIEMQIKAVQQKLRIEEIPVSYRNRIGVSKVSGNLRASILAGIKILWTVFRYRIHP
jgi:glycosyltransferase involved in cell wall biosynthesis